MNYKQTLDWMFKQLPMYQRVGKKAYKANLDNTLALDQYLKHPHYNYPTVHVAGTNGKGSTCHMIASVLQRAGYRVGLYTSPHLKDFRERIRVNGEPCSQNFVVDFIAAHREFFLRQQLSFFEMTVGMAFQYFKESQVDIAVIETGLGGRLDSTNIITPLVSVITSIDKDHTAILGNTLTKIASEKAGIIKPNVPVVVGELRGWLRARFRESAINKHASYYQVNHRKKALESDLKGHYQQYNIRTAVKTVEVLQEVSDFEISSKDIIEGFKNVKTTTGLRGRYETLQSNPRVIVETAHNPAGIKELTKQLDQEDFNELRIVLGAVSDKDISQVIELLPKNAIYYLCAPAVPRAMDVDQLATYFAASQKNFELNSSVSGALKKAVQDSKCDDLIIVTGSVFVVAEVV